MADIVLKDRQGVPQTYAGYSKVAFNTPDSGTVIFSEGDAKENVPIELDLAIGNQTVEAQSGALIKSAVIKKPTTLSPANIAKDVNVAGVVGTFIGNGLENVEIIPDFSDGDQMVTAEGDTLIKSAIMRKPETLVPENIANGVEVAGVTGTLSGGGAEVESGVIFIDYDGSIVESWKSASVASKTALPDNPSHARLVAQGWNWDLSHIKSYIKDYPMAVVVVGQLYKTASGLTEFDITLNKVTGLTVTCRMVGNKNWGDGTSDELTSHTYEDYGNYTITCDGTELPAGGYNDGGVFGSSGNNHNSYWCTKVHIGELVQSFGSACLDQCLSLEYLTAPRGLNTRLLQNCYRLKCLIIPAATEINAVRGGYSIKYVSTPQDAKTIKYYAFYNCSHMRCVTIPKGVTTAEGDTFYGCASLEKIVVPKSLLTAGTNMLRECSSLEKVWLHSITSISNSMFYGTNRLMLLDFSGVTAVPTLSSTDSLPTLNNLCKIIVPDFLYSDWVVATNWATFADYIYPVKVPHIINRYKSAVNEIVSGTSLTTSVNCNVGDMVVATFAIRGNTYTIPSDWTLLGISDVVSYSGVSQRTAMAYKYAESTTESITITQDSSARIYTNLVAIQGATGIAFNGFVTQGTGSAITVNRPRGLIVWGVSSVAWSATSPYPLWNISNIEDIKAIQLGTATQSRCLTALDQSIDETITFTYQGTGDGALACGSCTITGIPNFWYY